MYNSRILAFEVIGIAFLNRRNRQPGRDGRAAVLNREGKKITDSLQPPSVRPAFRRTHG